jgi:hypothetical protein
MSSAQQERAMKTHEKIGLIVENYLAGRTIDQDLGKVICLHRGLLNIETDGLRFIIDGPIWGYWSIAHAGHMATESDIRFAAKKVLQKVETEGMNLEALCRAAGWDKGGDIIFHMPTWGSWKAAASWAGENNPDQPDSKPLTYDTWEACFQEEVKTQRLSS